MLKNNENILFVKYLVDLNIDVRELLYIWEKNFELIGVDFNCFVKIKKSLLKQYNKILILDVEKWLIKEEMGFNED